MKVFCVSLLLLTAVAGVAAEPERPPNVIVILADDLGYGDVGVYGSEIVKTPNIDTLAQQGVLFSDGYVAAAVCSPSRAALMTGRYPQRFGYHFNTNARQGLPRSERVMAEHFKEAGYATGLIGKWQLGMQKGQHPLDRGFDEFFGLASGSIFIEPNAPGVESWNSGPLPETRQRPVIRGREPVEEETYLTDAFTREALDFIDRHHESPFFLYLAHYAPHVPLQATREYLERYPEMTPPRRRIFAAMVSALDDGVGRVVDRLRAHGLQERTLIVFLSDNGCALYTRGACTNDPLSGGKRYQLEGGVRVPFMMSWPGRLPAGKRIHEPVISLDILPTALAAAGIGKPDDIDGINLLPYVEGRTSAVPDRQFFWQAGPNKAIRDGNWKMWKVNKADPALARDLEPGALIPGWTSDGSPHGQLTLLYDLGADISERHDLSLRHPEVVERLSKALDAWSENMPPPSVQSDRGTIATVEGQRVELIF